MFACSGPRSGILISENTELGYILAAVLGGVLLLSVVAYVIGRRLVGFPVILLGLLAVHPAWTVSALQGDCGESKRDLSWACTVVGGLVFGWQVVYLIGDRPRRGLGAGDPPVQREP